MADDDLSIESCSACRYFVPGASKHTRAADGACHRNAPMQLSADPVEERHGSEEDEYGVMTMVTIGSYFGWPAILGSDWCGEFEARAGAVSTDGQP